MITLCFSEARPTQRSLTEIQNQEKNRPQCSGKVTKLHHMGRLSRKSRIPATGSHFARSYNFLKSLDNGIREQSSWGGSFSQFKPQAQTLQQGLEVLHDLALVSTPASFLLVIQHLQLSSKYPSYLNCYPSVLFQMPGIPHSPPPDVSWQVPQLLLQESAQMSVQFSSVTQSCPTLCDSMNCSTPGFPVHHQLPEFTQTHAHRVSDAIQPSHPLSSPSPPAPNPSQHQSLFQ